MLYSPKYIRITNIKQKKKYFSDMGVLIVISDYEAISNANNKFKLMKVAESLSLPTQKTLLFPI